MALPSVSQVRSYQDDFRRIFDEIREFCEKNKRMAVEKLEARAVDEDHENGDEENADDFVHVEGGRGGGNDGSDGPGSPSIPDSELQQVCLLFFNH